MNLQQHLVGQQDKKADHLNMILTQKVGKSLEILGYGFAQEKLTRSLYLLLFSEGCESIVLGLLLPILTQEWQLGTFQQSMLITVVYIGVSIGSYLQVYSDQYGRYVFITWDATLQTVFGVFSCFCWNYNSFLFARFFYGIGIGICLPLSASYITQISPSSMRATLLAKSRVYWSLGCLSTCLLGWLLLGYSWRILLFLICLPGMYAIYEHKTHGKESLRYLWVKKNINQVHNVLTLMCKLNNKPSIQRKYIQSLINQDSKKVIPAVNIPLGQLFNQKYSRSSYRLISSWFSVCFIYYGVMLLLPSILQRVFSKANMSQNFKYSFLVVITGVEVLSFYASTFIMDHPEIGRKKSVYYGFLIIFTVTCLIFLFGQDNKIMLFLIFLMIKFVVSATFMSLYPYTAEIYQTLLRGKALGICSMSGRIATTLLGIVGVYAMGWLNGYGLYFIFALLSAISGYGAYTMPYCTGGNRPIQ